MKVIRIALVTVFYLIILAGIGLISWQTYTINQRLTNIETNLNALPKPGDLKNQPSGQTTTINNTNGSDYFPGNTKPGNSGSTGTDTAIKPVQPVPSANGVSEIYNHAVFLSQSTDPTSFTDAETETFQHASVPETILLNNGDLYMYFVDANATPPLDGSGLGFSQSTDNGKTWSDRQAVVISNKINQGSAVDPSAVQLDNGDIRLYFFGPDKNLDGDPAQQQSLHTIYSATSSDGLNFTAEAGTRFSKNNLTDPDVVKLNNTWIMYFSLGQTTGIATSTDGLTFTDTDTTWSGGGVPGAYVDANNIVHLYGCSSNGIMTSSSNDGVTFSGSATSTGLTGCDPSPVLMNDGSLLMTYKKILFGS